MNWNTQFENMMKSWADTQKKVFEGYFSSMQGMQHSQYKRMWEATLEMGEEMLKNMLKTQLQGLSAWVDGLGKMENAPPQVVESARQFQEMAARWNKTQMELLENWFSMVKKFSPSTPSADWTEMPETMFKSWQDTMQDVMNAQGKWMNTWKDQTGKSANE